MDVVVNSGSEYITKRGNLLYEDINNPFKVSKFSLSSVSFLFIEFTESGESVLSVNNVLVGLVREFPCGFFRVESNFKINSKFFKITVSLFFILMKSGNFLLGFDLISSSIEGSFDFVGFKSFDTFSEMVIKSIEHSSNFIVDGSSQIAGVNSGYEMFSIKFISGIISNNFTSS